MTRGTIPLPPPKNRNDKALADMAVAEFTAARKAQSEAAAELERRREEFRKDVEENCVFIQAQGVHVGLYADTVTITDTALIGWSPALACWVPIVRDKITFATIVPAQASARTRELYGTIVEDLFRIVSMPLDPPPRSAPAGATE